MSKLLKRILSKKAPSIELSHKEIKEQLKASSSISKFTNEALRIAKVENDLQN